MPLSTGARLGPYEIQALLGAGGMGEVYRAKDTRLDRTVAVKVLTAQAAGGSSRAERFAQEARAISRLSHPHICALYDVGEHENAPFLVMEHVQGQTLAERLESGPVTLAEVLRIGTEIAEALDAAHREGVVHRDLKPGNVMLTREGVKLLDFGLAKLHETVEGEDLDATASKALTEEGEVLGTVPYMSPEQLEGQQVDARTDIFSLGAVLYEAVTGARPFQGKSRASLIAAILKEEPPPLSSLQPLTPPVLERVVKRCLAKDPDDRWQSARDLAAELRWIAEGGSQPGQPRPAEARRARTRVTWLAAAGLGVLGGGATAWVLAERGVIGSRSAGPRFERLTFRRGTLSSARFAPDGQSIVYSAAWEGSPYEAFLTRRGGTDARPLGLGQARILSISARGEMALVAGGQRLVMGEGTLVRASLAGGAPRELLTAVREADWTPDGAELAVARRVQDRDQVEFPIGRKLHEAPNVWSLRVSPDGNRVAFFAGPWHTQGDLVVGDRNGKLTTLSKGWLAGNGLAWSPRGDEVWFAGTRGDIAPALYAVSFSGRERVLAQAPDALYLQDVSRDGRALVLSLHHRQGIACLPPGEREERELGWLDASWVEDLSADGRTVLFSEEEAGGGRSGAVYLRATDGSPAVRIGDGLAEGLSPDGKWALVKTRDPQQFLLLPTHAGSPRALPRGTPAVLMEADWLDARRVVFQGTETGHGARVYVQDVEDGTIRPLTPEGVTIPAANAATPDGRFVTAFAGGRWELYPVEGGEPRPIAHLTPEDGPLQWSPDGRHLFVRRGGPVPVEIQRLDVATGARQPWRTLVPKDPVGVERLHPIVLTPDGGAYCYTYQRVLTELFLTEGLR